MSNTDDPRRKFLVNALTAGVYAVGGMGDNTAGMVHG